MAPEQARGDKVDGRADLFSLGCVLYRVCTGRHPWKGGDAMETLVAIATENPKPVLELNPDLPPKFARLITKLLGKKPEDRPASAKAVAESIQAIERDQPAQMLKAPLAVPMAAPAYSPPGNTLHDASQATGMLVRRIPPKSRRRRLPWLVLGACAALVAAVMASVIYVQTDTGTLKIETADDKVQVIVEKGGKQVKVIDKANGSSVTLDAGEYRLKLGQPRADIKLDKDKVTIAQQRRGGGDNQQGKAIGRRPGEGAD